MWSIVCEGKQEDGQWQLTGWAVFQTKNFKISWLKYAWEKSLKIMAALQNTLEDSLNVPHEQADLCGLDADDFRLVDGASCKLLVLADARAWKWT